MFIFLTLIGLLAGVLIGTIGIGGIILVPFLSFVLGFDLHFAMAASSLSFFFQASLVHSLMPKKDQLSGKKCCG